MKATTLIAACIFATMAAMGQGTVHFSNYVPNLIDAPFFNDHGERLEGTNYLAQLYAGTTEQVLVPVGSPVPFLTNGYLTPTSPPFKQIVVTIPATIVDMGGPAWVQVRTWDSAGGASFEEAALGGRWTGISSELFLPGTGHRGVNPAPPAFLYGFEPGGYTFVPLRYPGNPIIVQNPQAQNVKLGTSASLSVVASGGITLFYRWYQGESGNTNQPIVGAINATYTTPPLTTNSTFWVNVYNSVGSTNSTSATVAVYIVRLDLRMISGWPGLVIDGVLDTPFRIEYGTSLSATNWTGLVDLSLHTSPFTLIDTTATNSLTRFYRIVAH